MQSLTPANYTHRMRRIEARRNAALRDSDCASLRLAVQQEADLNHLFWLGSDVAPNRESRWPHLIGTTFLQW
jgi:hypothetical protein